MLPACPNCGKDVREDFAFCPYCEYPLKPFCPSCRRELQAEFIRCPYCGFKLRANPSAAQLYRRGGLPAGLIAVSLLWLATGIINLGQGTTAASSDLTSYQGPYAIPLPALAQNGLLLLVGLWILMALIGAVQLATVYGLLSRKAWSYRTSLGMAAVAVLLYALILATDTLVSGSYSSSPQYLRLIPTGDTALLVWSLAVLVVLRVYLGRDYVRDVLNIQYLPTVP